MTRILATGRRKRGAMILAFALGLTLIAGITSMLMARTLMDHKRLNERRRDLWRAFYFAESGIAQVQQWALYPDQYTFDTDLFMEVNETGTVAERFVNLAVAIDAGGFTVTEQDLADMGNALGLSDPVGYFETESGWNLGRIKQISIVPPDPANDPIPSFFKIEAIGRSVSGRERSVTGYADANPIIEIQIPAALISLTTANVYGNGRVHWGEAWTKTGMKVPSNSQMNYIHDPANPDPWAKYRSEQLFIFPNNWNLSSTYQSGRLYDSGSTSIQSEGFTLPSADQPGLFPITNDGDWADVFYQNVPPGTLDFPDLLSNYTDFKQLAQANGRYYYTDANGNIFDGNDNPVTHFLDEFGVTSHAGSPHDLVFIDNPNGAQPDGTFSLPTINIQGNGSVNDLGLKGVYYFAVNVDIAGVGGPPPLEISDPDGNSITENIWLNGVLYSAGDIEFTGNPMIFGSVLAENGFDGGGTPDIYYNEDLADGMIIDDGNVGAPFNIVLHNNFAP